MLYKWICILLEYLSKGFSKLNMIFLEEELIIICYYIEIYLLDWLDDGRGGRGFIENNFLLFCMVFMLVLVRVKGVVGRVIFILIGIISDLVTLYSFFIV